LPYKKKKKNPKKPSEVNGSTFSSLWRGKSACWSTHDLCCNKSFWWK